MSALRFASADELRRQAALALHAEPAAQVFDPNRPPGRGDHDLNPGEVPGLVAVAVPKPAAVLIPVVTGSQGLSVLLTQRTDTLPTHAGQVAFPGGKLEPGDATPLAAALRETEEEIGLAARFVEPIGYLDSYQTGTGYRVVPVVALIRPGFALTLDAREVADTFEVPLDFLMDPANHQRHAREWRGKLRHFYAMPFGERYIWGATAGMLRNFYERLHHTCSGSSSSI